MHHDQRNFCKALRVVMTLIIFAACTTVGDNERYDLSRHVGLYRIDHADCLGYQKAENPCLTDAYIELRKGTFHGIKESDLAIVFWHGNSNEGQLLYLAREVPAYANLRMFDRTIYLTDRGHGNQRNSEYFVINNQQIVEYQYKKLGASRAILKHVTYKLKKQNHDEIQHHLFQYPRND